MLSEASPVLDGCLPYTSYHYNNSSQHQYTSIETTDQSPSAISSYPGILSYPSNRMDYSINVGNTNIYQHTTSPPINTGPLEILDHSSQDRSSSSSLGAGSVYHPVYRSGGINNGQSNSGSSNILYRKLAPTLPVFGKDKSSDSIIERWIFVYNRRLTSLAKLCIILMSVSFILLLLMSTALMVSDFGLRCIVTSVILAFAGLCFSFWMLAWILKFDEGTQEMRDVALSIREGSEGFFAVQYGTIFKITFIFAVSIFMLYLFRDNSAMSSSEVTNFQLAAITATTFIFGAFCSALSGYSGMWVSVRTNVRVASAARRCYNDALQLCFRGGAFSSIINVALAVGGIAASMFVLMFLYPAMSFVQLPLLLVGYGFGASLVAMFAQLGGGIYTKAADVGADLVGKVEAGIPEDDPRNPAVIADLVGDNVGDCAGQCADLFESISAEIVAAMILGGALANEAKMSAKESAGFVLFPLAVHCMDLVVSSIGILFVKTNRGIPDSESSTGGVVDPLKIMIRSYLITCLMATVGFTGLCRVFLYTEARSFAWKYYAACGVVGMICAFLFVLITQYYTDYEYPKVRRIAEASLTGPATNIIAGMSVGLESTALPVLLISACVISAFCFGLNTELLPPGKTMSGLFGTAVATMGMLCTAVFVLSMSSFGPIADNAGGIVEMTQQEESVRAITDRLDAVGNVTKANTKGFSVGSASLACFLLFSAFLDEVSVYSKQAVQMVDLSVPEVFIGGLLGSAMVFLFCGWAMEAVGRAAQEVVKEVRRQFRELPGIMDFTERPDYHTCVAIVSRSALREMIRPGLLAIFSPIVVGYLFRYLGDLRQIPTLGAQATASFLMFCTATGILMALFLNNGGGAWDNAKKYVETGAFGGKGSEAHKAAVVGDTVGDPCKDTAGPSVHVLIKLVSTVTMVLTPVFISAAFTSESSLPFKLEG